MLPGGNTGNFPASNTGKVNGKSPGNYHFYVPLGTASKNSKRPLNARRQSMPTNAARQKNKL